MGYAQAFRLLAAGYKKIKGKMPEGLDLLKIKQEARKKAIDAQKVIKVNFDKANNWMKAKPQSTKVKGKAAETEAEMIARMNRQNKESVKRLKDKKEKSLGEKLRDYKGDPDAMATGGRVRFAQGGVQYTPTTAQRDLLKYTGSGLANQAGRSLIQRQGEIKAAEDMLNQSMAPTTQSDLQKFTAGLNAAHKMDNISGLNYQKAFDDYRYNTGNYNMMGTQDSDAITAGTARPYFYAGQDTPSMISNFQSQFNKPYGYANIKNAQYTPTTARRMQNAQATSPTSTGIQNVPTAQQRNIQQRQMTQKQIDQAAVQREYNSLSQSVPTSLLDQVFTANNNLSLPNSSSNPRDSLTGMLESEMLPNPLDGSMRSIEEMDAIRDRVLAAQEAAKPTYQERLNGESWEMLSDNDQYVIAREYPGETPQKRDPNFVPDYMLATGGRVNFNTGGGVSNVVGTYLANPSLQDKYTQQEYEDFFGYGTNQPSTTTTTATNVVQPSRVASPIVPNIIKPILPIVSTDGGDGGGDPINPRGNPNFDYETEAYGLANLTPEQKGITQEEQDMLDKEKSGILNLLSFSPAMKTLGFIKNKAAAGKKQLDDFFTRRAEEKAAKEAAEAKLAAERNRIQQIIDSGSSVDRATGGQFGTSVNEPTGSRGSGTGFSNYS